MRRDSFILPDQQVYLCGHSLGPCPINMKETINQTIDAFQKQAVAGWNQQSWIDLPQKLGSKIAQLIGAKDHEVTIGDSTVLNLYKVIQAALGLQDPKRCCILTTDDNFPADIYIAKGCAPVKTVPYHEIIDHLSDDIGILLLTQVNYRSAEILDIQAIGELAKRKGIITIFDLSHSIGILPIHLDEHFCDFAVGCTYKYLSAGPGSPAFIYANQTHHINMKSPIQGWMGHINPFAFSSEYVAQGISKFQGGTPHILSMKGLEAALEIIDRDIVLSVSKITQDFRKLAISKLTNMGLSVLRPKHGGGHVSFFHQDGLALSIALSNHGIQVDYRHPNLIRMCINPLYLTEQDLLLFFDCLNHLLQSNDYQRTQFQQHNKVT